eukprot:TRINITY_DN8427_c0_g2_i1.p3 TRINITY_DN8427_c0_g2~~TRINITY_DN8427_c0_g2_i1.p3  ORF type:complete len:106 (-),score=1.81 TRINITY_DN8427_c0_g2_i1:212-529(-)
MGLRQELDASRDASRARFRGAGHALVAATNVFAAIETIYVGCRFRVHHQIRLKTGFRCQNSSTRRFHLLLTLQNAIPTLLTVCPIAPASGAGRHDDASIGHGSTS